MPQCGYCINGWIMTAATHRFFLIKKKKPSDAEIKDPTTKSSARCEKNMGILRAVKRAAETTG